AAAVVAELRFDDDGLAELLSGFPGVGSAFHNATFRNRHADVADQSARELLVLGDELGDRTGAVGLGGTDVVELGAIAQLHQAAGAEADLRNAAVAGGIDNRCRAWAEANFVH